MGNSGIHTQVDLYKECHLYVSWCNFEVKQHAESFISQVWPEVNTTGDCVQEAEWNLSVCLLGSLPCRSLLTTCVPWWKVTLLPRNFLYQDPSVLGPCNLTFNPSGLEIPGYYWGFSILHNPVSFLHTLPTLNYSQIIQFECTISLLPESWMIQKAKSSGLITF